MSAFLSSRVNTLFLCESAEAYSLKVLSELLKNNINTAYFTIDKDTIRLRTMDTKKRTLIDLYLESENFSVYKYDSTEKSINIGFNLNHFYTMLKNIKKKDSIILFINKEKKNDLGIQVIPQDNNRITTSYIRIQNIQNIDIDLPEGYKKPILVQSSEYQKMCKDLDSIGKIINITSMNEFYIKFLCNSNNVYSREVEFGIGNVNNFEETFNQDFDTEKLKHIIKISGLSNTIKIYTQKGLPILFKSKIGNLGEISIFVKSRQQIEEENNI